MAMTVPCMKPELDLKLKISWRNDTCNDEDDITASHMLVIELDECSGLDFKEPPTLSFAAMARTVFWATKISWRNAQWNNNDEYGFTSFEEWSDRDVKEPRTLSHAVMAMPVPCAPKSTIRCNWIWTLKKLPKRWREWWWWTGGEQH
jgi:hypothetical protein